MSSLARRKMTKKEESLSATVFGALLGLWSLVLMGLNIFMPNDPMVEWLGQVTLRGVVLITVGYVTWLLININRKGG